MTDSVDPMVTIPPPATTPWVPVGPSAPGPAGPTGPPGSGGGGGAEIGYDAVTANVTVSSTNQAAGTLIITCGAHTFDGSPVMVEFFCPTCGPTAAVGISLFEGSTQITNLYVQVGGNGPATGRYRFTPSAGSHTYKVTGYVNSGSAGLTAGNGGTGAVGPMFIRFTKA